MHSSRTQSGFTIVETLVAIAVITIGIVGPLTVLNRTLNATTYAKEKVTAIFLAEDALEYLKNVRDSDALSAFTDQASATDYFFGDVLPKCLDTLCKVETTTNFKTNEGANATVTVCTGSCPPLQYSESLNVYSHKTGAGWSPSIYTRTVYVTKFPDPSLEYKIRVEVTWKNNSVSLDRNFSNIVRNLP